MPSPSACSAVRIKAQEKKIFCKPALWTCGPDYTASAADAEALLKVGESKDGMQGCRSLNSPLGPWFAIGS